MIIPVLVIFFIFIYNYHKFIDVSKKIREKIDNDIVENIRKKENPIFIHADNSCLYNHNNLCQHMLYID